MPVINIEEVSKLYGFGDATTVALDEVDFEVEKGEFVAVMGPSGSGKSTLMNIIGLLDRPTHGSYKLNNTPVEKLKPNQRARARRDKIGFVFQFSNLLPRMNVINNVALPLAYKRIATVRRLTKASTVLERVGLKDREYFMPRQLSGGQTQRAAIARALVNDPSIIIADEPTGNLDSASSRVVMELLSEIHKAGNTILMVTHNPELTRYASRVVYMQDGAIIHDEDSKIGQVPKILKETMYSIRATNEDDDLAGVSALMNILPQDQDQKQPKKHKKKRSSKKTRQHKEPAKSEDKT